MGKVKREFNPVLSVLIDQVMILLFAAIGLVNHDRVDPASLLTWDGIFRLFGVAFPFMLAAFLAWAGLIVRSFFQLLPVGIIVWAATVVVGMTFRVMNGQSIQPTFVLVAAALLAVFLVGWRVVVAFILNRRPAEVDTPL